MLKNNAYSGYSLCYLYADNVVSVIHGCVRGIRLIIFYVVVITLLTAVHCNLLQLHK
jgi:hypothetical protein